MRVHSSADSRFKEKGEQFDDRVIEVCWDTERSGWRFMRFRDDKLNANHKSIMRKIIDSISDGVELEAVSLCVKRADESS